MGRNTKIQLRRGLASQWADLDPVLAEGEIGYEIDSGRFKIGKNNIQWSILPYAGGSDIIPGTGVATIFNSVNNSYTIHSIIESSGNGLYVNKLDLVGDGTTNASGTYYKIGLDDRLQALANNNNSGILVGTNESGIITRFLSEGSNIDITNKDGIENNPTIGLSEDITLTSVNITGVGSSLSVSNDVGIGGAVTVSGVNIRNITSNITVTEAVGGLSKGTVLNSASGITEVLRTILEKVFEPTVGQQPSASITLSGSVSPAGSSSSFTHNGRYEVGTTGNITILSTLSQGFVAGSGLGAEWVEDGNQGVRAGIATAFNRSLEVLSNTAFNTSNTFDNYTIVLGSNIASAAITHSSGITPVNSLGVNSTVLTVLPAGNTVSGSRTFTGVRRLFYNFDTTGLAPTTSADIRSLASTAGTFESGKSVFNFGVGTVLRVTPIPGTKRVVIAVPAELYSLGNTITVLDETSLNANISSSYILTQISVSGANNFDSVPYNVYTFIPDVPFPTSSVHKITIN